MYQPEDNFDRDLSKNSNSNKNTDDIDANLSPKNVAVRKKQLEKIFIKLIAIGLALGAVLGVGTYFLLNKLGLTKKPYQIEQEKQENKSDGYNETQYFPHTAKSFPFKK